MALHASPLTVVVALGDAIGVPVYGQYGTIVGLAERSLQLFPPGETSSSRPAGVAVEDEAILGPSRVQEEVSSVDSNELDSVVRSLSSDGISITLEGDEDEDPPEIIPDDSDEEALAELYMPPNEVGSAASVAVDMGWIGIYLENQFCNKGPIYFAFPDGYKLVLPAEGGRITDCPPGHVAIYGICWILVSAFLYAPLL